MKRNYKYEKEMLHWLDGGDVEQRACGEEDWEPFDGEWVDNYEYRIAQELAEKPKEERWLYVNQYRDTDPWLTEEITTDTIGKIRMEDV